MQLSDSFANANFHDCDEFMFFLQENGQLSDSF